MKFYMSLAKCHIFDQGYVCLGVESKNWGIEGYPLWRWSKISKQKEIYENCNLK